MKLHDFDLLAFPRVIGLGDARVLRGHADGTAGPIALGDALVRPLGLGHDEAARTEFEVHELDGARLRLEQGIFPADAAIGSSKLHEHRGIGGAHDNVLDAGVADDELAPRVGEARRVKATCRKARDGVGVERAFGHGDAQRTRSRLLLGRCGGKRLVEVEREPGGGATLAVGADRVVVAPTGAKGCPECGGEGDEHDACVIVKRAHDREVDEDAVGQALLVELLEGALEVGQAVLAAERRYQIAHARNRLSPAADVRERADGLREDGCDPCLLRARPRELVELDEVAGVVGGKHARLPRLAGAASCE